MTDQHPLGQEATDPQQGDGIVCKMIIAVGVLGILIVVVRLLFPFALNLILTFGSTGDCPSPDRISLSELSQQIQRDNVEEIIVRGGQEVCARFRDGTEATYYKERETDLFASLRTFGVEDSHLQRIIFRSMPR